MDMGQSVELGSLTHKQPLPGTPVLCSPQVQTVSVLFGCSSNGCAGSNKVLVLQVGAKRKRQTTVDELVTVSARISNSAIHSNSLIPSCTFRRRLSLTLCLHLNMTAKHIGLAIKAQRQIVQDIPVCDKM